MVMWNIPNSNNPVEQLEPCLVLMRKIIETRVKLDIDMSNIPWITPFAALLVSHAIRQNKEMVAIITPKDQNVANYLQAIGFPLGKATRGTSYCPIHHFTRDAQAATDNVYTIVDETFPKTVKEGSAVRYIISELCDNIDQHSRFTQAAVVAQRYGKADKIGIGVIDDGIGIPGSFKEHNIVFTKDTEALQKAVSGVSAKKGEGDRGWGLPSSLRIVHEGYGGTFFICSGKAAMVIGQGLNKIYILPGEGLNGTAVYCYFGIPKQAVDIAPFTN